MKIYNYTKIAESTVCENGAKDRFCFAFILYVGNKVKGRIVSDWWATEAETMAYKIGMMKVAKAFQKTAKIAVYVKAEQTHIDTGETANVWQFYGGNVNVGYWVPEFIEFGALPKLLIK